MHEGDHLTCEFVAVGQARTRVQWIYRTWMPAGTTIGSSTRAAGNCTSLSPVRTAGAGSGCH